MALHHDAKIGLFMATGLLLGAFIALSHGLADSASANVDSALAKPGAASTAAVRPSQTT